jgi:hypothetical protein
LATVRCALVVAAGALSVVAESPVAATLDELERQHREQVDAVAEVLEKGVDLSDTKRIEELRAKLEKARKLAVKTSTGQFFYRSDAGDFYYAWVMCRVRSDPKAADTGALLLRKMQQNDSLSEERQALLRAELQKCGKATSASISTDTSITRVSYRTTTRLLITAVHKGGRGGSQPIRFPGIPRLAPVEPDSIAQASKGFENLLGPGYLVIQAGPFVIAGRRAETYLRRLHEKVLDPYYSYLTSRLGIVEERNIFVAVAGDPREAVRVGAAFYGSQVVADPITLDSVLAYSDSQARLMVAVCGKDPANCTSFAHELFHLLNGRVYEDAPWWLYEGMAELFESGDIVGHEFVPSVGWRKRDLDYEDLQSQGMGRLLSLPKVSAYWQSWPGPEREMAKARFFAQYLHEHGQLWPLYEAMRARPSESAGDDPAGLQVLHARVGPIEKLAPAFQKWALERVKPAEVAPGP